MSDEVDILEMISDEDTDIDVVESDTEIITVQDMALDTVDDLDEEQARELTDSIRSTASATYVLLTIAHERKAHKALGYDSWVQYCEKEFSMSSSRSYQLLDLGKTIKAIEEAAPEGTKIRLTEAQARDIKRELPKITEVVATETSDLEPEDAAQRVAEIIEEQRETQKAEDKAVKKRQEEIAEAEQEGYQKGVEAAADAMLENAGYDEGGNKKGGDYDKDDRTGNADWEPSNKISSDEALYIFNFFNVLNSVTSLPDPSKMVSIIPDERAIEVSNQLEVAAEWLNNFVTAWKER